MSEKIKRAFLAIQGTCTHATLAEDTSDYAFMHRTYGCPNKGVKWPLKAMKALPERRLVESKCQACGIPFERQTPLVSVTGLGDMHLGCYEAAKCRQCKGTGSFPPLTRQVCSECMGVGLE